MPALGRVCGGSARVAPVDRGPATKTTNSIVREARLENIAFSSIVMESMERHRRRISSEDKRWLTPFPIGITSESTGGAISLADRIGAIRRPVQ